MNTKVIIEVMDSISILVFKQNSTDVFETQKILLKKVEELTLYMISLDEQISELKKLER